MNIRTASARSCHTCGQPAFALHISDFDAAWLCQAHLTEVEEGEGNTPNNDANDSQRGFDCVYLDAWHAIAAPRYVRWDPMCSRN